MRLLLVEDEPEMATLIISALTRQDILVDHAPSLGFAREALISTVYDMIVLDRMLPDGEGLSLLTILRREIGSTPVIMLSALSSIENRIEGLDKGADDYLSKPFAVDELLARIRALRRRPNSVSGDAITLGKLRFDIDNREASVDGAALELPRRELLVLEALLRRAGRTVTRAGLEEAVFGYDDAIASNSLDAHVSRLRRKLADAQTGVEIHAIRGIGYLIKKSA